MLLEFDELSAGSGPDWPCFHGGDRFCNETGYLRFRLFHADPGALLP